MKPHFTQLYQLSAAEMIASNVHHQLRAAGLRTWWVLLMTMKFQNTLTARKTLRKNIGHTDSVVAESLRTLSEHHLIYKDTKIIRVMNKYAYKGMVGSRDKSKGAFFAKQDWFKLWNTKEAVELITHEDLKFYEHCLILYIFGQMGELNKIKLNISEAARKLRVPRNRCSEAFKKLKDVGFIIERGGDFYVSDVVGMLDKKGRIEQSSGIKKERNETTPVEENK